MPPQQRSSPHSRSLSPHSRTLSRNERNLGPPIDVYRFDELIDLPEDYDRIQAALFGRHDLMIKTIMYKHLHDTTEQLWNEVQRQSVIAV